MYPQDQYCSVLCGTPSVVGIGWDGVGRKCLFPRGFVGPSLVLSISARNVGQLQSIGFKRFVSDWRCQSSTTRIPNVESGPSCFTHDFGSVRITSLEASSMWMSVCLKGKLKIVTDYHEVPAIVAVVATAIVVVIDRVFRGDFSLVDVLFSLIAGTFSRSQCIVQQMCHETS
jgi:hypothetical protein